MFKKLIAPEPLNLLPETIEKIRSYAEEFTEYSTAPDNDDELMERIKDADGLLLNVHTLLDEKKLRQCGKLKYIGLCCTLYEDDSCSVHLPTAKDMGIKVTGVSDYGDNGVPEFVIAMLADFLHGFSGKQWLDVPMEIWGLNIGVMGLGTTGTLVASALRHFGANVFYNSRTRKPQKEELLGVTYDSPEGILEKCDIVCTCLNKFVCMMTEERLRGWTGGKILVNTGLTPSYDEKYIEKWLNEGNYLFCDSPMALGDSALANHPNVRTPGKFAGSSKQTTIRLGEGVIKNIEEFLK